MIQIKCFLRMQISLAHFGLYSGRRSCCSYVGVDWIMMTHFTDNFEFRSSDKNYANTSLNYTFFDSISHRFKLQGEILAYSQLNLTYTVYGVSRTKHSINGNVHQSDGLHRRWKYRGIFMCDPRGSECFKSWSCCCWLLMMQLWLKIDHHLRYKF